MCDHKWIPLKLEAIHPVSVNTAMICSSQTLGYRVTETICVECLETRTVAESPSTEANKMINDYRKSVRKEV